MAPLSTLLHETADQWVNAIKSGIQPAQSLPPKVSGPETGFDHVVLGVWHPRLRDGRLFNIIAQDESQGWRKVGLANLNLHVFPRGSTLNERFRARVFRSEACCQITVAIQDIAPAIQWTGGTNLLTVSVSLWEKLSPSQEVLDLQNTALNFLIENKEDWTSDKIMNWAVENARPMRSAYGKTLKSARGKAIDLIVETGDLTQLCKATADLSTEEDLRRAGLNEGDEITIGCHAELLDLFMGFLQALAHYAPEARTFTGLLYQPEQENMVHVEDHGCSLIAVSSGNLDLSAPLPQGTETLNEIYKRVDGATQESFPSVEIDGLQAPALLTHLLLSWEKTIWNDCPVGMHLPGFVQRLVRVAELLSTDVHEGRRCCYTFALGSGAIWRTIDETISYESAGPTLSVESFVRLVRSHWSIFQQPRIAGLVEITDIPHLSKQKRVFLSKLVKFRTSPQGEASKSLLFRYVTGLDQSAVVIHTRGDGGLLIYQGGNLAYRLEVATGAEASGSGVSLDAIADSALRACSQGWAQGELEYLRGVLLQVVEEISDASGEGCLAVFVHDKGPVEAFLGQMDRKDNRMRWRYPKSILGLDASLLRSFLILDGATLVSKDKVEPRLLIYPHDDSSPAHSFDAISLLSQTSSRQFFGILKEALRQNGKLSGLLEGLLGLDGKGTKHHGAANLTLLLWYKKYANQLTDFQVVTVSADGPVTQWTRKLSLE